MAVEMGFEPTHPVIHTATESLANFYLTIRFTLPYNYIP